MLCPNCFSEVQIINNAVYCPTCKVYISDSVEAFTSKFSQQEIIESKEKSKLLTGEMQKKLSVEKYKGIFKFIFSLSLKIAIPVLVVLGLLYSYLHFGANGYREEIFSNYGFTEGAKWYLRTTFISVGEPNNKHLPYNFVDSSFLAINRSVFVGSANDELAIHEIGHAWWWKVDKNDLTFKKRFIDDFIKMSEEKDKDYENASLFAASMRLSSFCNCLDDNTINYDSIDANHLFVLTAAFTMGKFKDGELKLPPYMWPYLGTMFTGKVKVATCYELKNCEHIGFDPQEAREKIKGKIKTRQ